MQSSGYDPKIHHRCSIRLPGYDYSQSGAYFVTICTHRRVHLFGDIINIVGAGSKPAPVEMRLNCYGKIVEDTWFDLPNHISGLKLGEFSILPNHTHGILWIIELNQIEGIGIGRDGAGFEPAPSTRKQTSLSEIVRQFKTFSARRINEIRGTPGQPVWQRNYYEHIIRDDESYNRIAEYILKNPLKWKGDKMFIP